MDTAVTTSNTHIASFTYDGDGRRVIATESGTTTIFIGNYFEWKNSAMTKYYYAGGQRIAVRNGDTSGSSQLSFLLSDHLGSTRLTYRADTAAQTSVTYTSWGVASGNFGTTTAYTYTGQYSYTATFGLMYYNARWYDPALKRFAQADSIVPNPGNPMSWDRYAYVLNNPLKYNDPHGHIACEVLGTEECDQNGDYVSLIILSQPNIPAPEGTEWVLVTPNGNGAVSWYGFPTVDNPDISHPSDLENQAYLKMQGSVLLNGQVWNYDLYSRQWERNEWAASRCSPPYGSSTQCVTPLENHSPTKPVTGAVYRHGLIPLGQDQLIYIQVSHERHPMGLLVNTRDECPGCAAFQVDILTTNPRSQTSYNLPKQTPTTVYIWVAIPISPNPIGTDYQ